MLIVWYTGSLMRKCLAKAITSSRLFAFSTDYFSEWVHKIGSLWSGFYNTRMTESIRTSWHDAFLFNYFIFCIHRSGLESFLQVRTSVFKRQFKRWWIEKVKESESEQGGLDWHHLFLCYYVHCVFVKSLYISNDIYIFCICMHLYYISNTVKDKKWGGRVEEGWETISRGKRGKGETVLQMTWYLFWADNDDDRDEYQMAGICQRLAVVVLGNTQERMCVTYSEAGHFWKGRCTCKGRGNWYRSIKVIRKNSDEIIHSMQTDLPHSLHNTAKIKRT